MRELLLGAGYRTYVARSAQKTKRGRISLPGDPGYGRGGGAHLDAEFIRELFAQFGPVTVRRMFRSAGIFADGLMFGLINDGTIYLKVDDGSIPDFEREGSQPFTYTRSKRAGRVELPYWRLPERLYDDPEELAAWARRAFAIAERKKIARPRAKQKRRRSPLTKSSAGRRRYRA
jgi:DNA transformation protein